MRFDQSYLIPDSFTTGPHRSASLRMKVANSALVVVTGNNPAASAFALMVGSARIFATSRCSLSTMTGRGALRSDEAEPDCKFVEVGQIGGGLKGRDLGSWRKRAIIEFRKNAELASLNERHRR